ncbi:MAG: SH3 domain-containing protein [Lachnospiraceae bacterium]|nr:SH3 domain-containing protein [Lachnospiraceae bacterium]
MNINKAFKIVTILLIVTAILALIAGVVAILSDDPKEEKSKKQNEVVTPDTSDVVVPATTDEALNGSDASENTSIGGDKNGKSEGDSLEDSEAVPEDDKTDVKHSDSGDAGDTVLTNPEDGSDTEKEDASVKNTDATPSQTAEGLPIGQSVSVENLKFDGSEEHFVLQNIEHHVNVRKEASISSEKVGELLKGAYGVILEKGEDFSRVKCGDLTGYVLNNYLMTGRAADEQIQGVSARKVKIDRAVFIRDDANMESNKIAIAPEGSVYSLDPTAPEVHGWVAIVYNDAPKAYVSASFCTVED